MKYKKYSSRCKISIWFSLQSPNPPGANCISHSVWLVTTPLHTVDYYNTYKYI